MKPDLEGQLIGCHRLAREIQRSGLEWSAPIPIRATPFEDTSVLLLLLNKRLKADCATFLVPCHAGATRQSQTLRKTTQHDVQMRSHFADHRQDRKYPSNRWQRDFRLTSDRR
jgi:hypothetical protein